MNSPGTQQEKKNKARAGTRCVFWRARARVPSIRRAWRVPPPPRGRRPTRAPPCPGPRLRTARTQVLLALVVFFATYISSMTRIKYQLWQLRYIYILTIGVFPYRQAANQVYIYTYVCVPGFAVGGQGRCRRRASAGCRSPAASSSEPLQGGRGGHQLTIGVRQALMQLHACKQ